MSNASIREKITKVPPIAVFLGAGASYPLGYPTTEKFIDHLKESLKSNGKNEELNFLHYLLENIKYLKDVEQVLELLEGLEEHYTTLPTSRFYNNFTIHVRVGGSDYNIQGVLKWISNLKEEIEKEVFQAFRWNPEIIDKAVDMYKPLLNNVESKSADKSNGIFIFTTNYDRVIEEVCIKLDEYDCIDGFRSTKGNKIVWSPEEFNRLSDEYAGFVKLFKLHGSLDWRERIDETLERVGAEERILGSPAHKRNILIYPTLTHKQNHNVQYLNELYDIFVSSMQRLSCCIVIGYSFRDENINKVFIDFINRKGTVLIAVSPSAERNVRKQLLKEEVAEDKITGESSERISVDRGNVIMINQKFGEERMLEEISKTLNRFTS